MGQADKATCEFQFENVELDCQVFARTAVLDLPPFFLLLSNFLIFSAITVAQLLRKVHAHDWRLFSAHSRVGLD